MDGDAASEDAAAAAAAAGVAYGKGVAALYDRWKPVVVGGCWGVLP